MVFLGASHHVRQSSHSNVLWFCCPCLYETLHFAWPTIIKKIPVDLKVSYSLIEPSIQFNNDKCLARERRIAGLAVQDNVPLSSQHISTHTPLRMKLVLE